MAGTISWKIGNGDCAVVMFSLPFDFNLYPGNWLSVGIMKESKNLKVLKFNRLYTGGPQLTRKSLTRLPLPGFLAYVRVSGGISVRRGPQYSPTNTNFMLNTFFQVAKCA